MREEWLGEFQMAGFLKRFFAKNETESLPESCEEQSVWIKAKISEYQAYWHELFDADEVLALKGDEFTRPDPLPSDIGSDFRLIIGLTDVSANTRAKCFSLFPQGLKMHQRFESFLEIKPHAMREAEAREGLKRIVGLIEEIGPNEEVDFSTVAIIDRDTKDGLNALTYTDDITLLLEGSLIEPVSLKNLPLTVARLFLTEPLYAAAGNYYQLRDWVTSAMYGDLWDEVHTSLYELWLGGWQVLLGQNGIILAKRQV